MNINQLLTQILEANQCEGISFQEIDQQATLIFSRTLSEKTYNIGLFYTQQDDLIIFQLYHRLENAYNKPETDFYEVINDLNSKSVLGNLLFVQENDDYYLAYKSNYFMPLESLTSNRYQDFSLFLKTSFEVLGILDSSVNA